MIKNLHSNSLRALLSGCILALLLLLQLSSNAQQFVVIDDPDLTFGYVLSDGWTYQDEDLYHKISHKTADIEIAITYIEEGCKKLKDCYEGEVFGLLPTEYENFEVMQEGKSPINGVDALWAKCKADRNKKEKVEIWKYFFIWENQFFKITVTGSPDDVEQYVHNIDFMLNGFYAQRR